MRILALHLPQFHEVEENNRWWGKGFTEWVSVKNAKPLFRGHQQPIHPLDDNYYDLSEASALTWQADLARNHDVDGFVFFHYWYSGKLMLERPVELWRDTPEADLGYALCWANHPWTRAWDGKEHDVLQAQTYGGQEDWENHLDYLLTFFRDDRYIKHEGKPVFVLYNAGAIPDVDDMVEFWNTRLVAEGFAGIYIIEYVGTKNPAPSCATSQAVYEDEPLYSLRFQIGALAKARRVILKKLNRPEYQNYDRIWSHMLRKRRTYGDRTVVRSAFVAWDNSPRRGKRGPMIVKNSTPDKFYKYMLQLLRSKRANASQDFTLINAWNEWGEGAILEPSREEGYGYIEALQRAVRDSKIKDSRPQSTVDSGA